MTIKMNVVILALLTAPWITAAGEVNHYSKDRQAILAMAGEYHVQFQFRETVAMRDGYTITEPYLADATEFVKVLEDSPRRIVLQHILVLHDDNGEKAPRVVKHWRQDWVYEDTEILAFQGHRTWKKHKLNPETVRGTWSQAVYQVDDSPRYEGVGRWRHYENQSVWESDETWRPLPRREYTKRDDYDVMVAVNRHVISAHGWVHEQDNYKLDLTRNKEQPIIAREVGTNVYTRVDDIDFTAGYQYWDKTHTFWAAVRQQWANIVAKWEQITLQELVEDEPLWTHMFEQGKSVQNAQSGFDDRHRSQLIKTLDNFLVEG